MQAKDRRRFPRVTLNLDVIVRKGGEESVLKTGNVSRYGMFLITDTPYAMGDELEFEISLSPSEPPVKGRGKVMWRQVPEELKDDQQPGMGIKITAMKTKQMEEWAKFVETVRLSQLSEDLLQAVVEPHTVELRPQEKSASFVVPISGIAELRRIYEDLLIHGGINVRIGSGKKPGEKIKLVIHHPWTGNELELTGKVLPSGKLFSSKGDTPVEIQKLDKKGKLKLHIFVETGYLLDCKKEDDVVAAVSKELEATESIIRKDPLNGAARLKAALLANFLGKTSVAKDYIEGARALKFEVPAELDEIIV